MRNNRSSDSTTLPDLKPQKSFSEYSGYDEFDAESRLPFRSIPTQMITHKVSKRMDHDIDLTKSNIYNANNVDTQYAIRKTKAATFILRYITNDAYRISSIFAVIIALFAYDFSRTLVYSSFDYVVECTLSVIFAFLLIDCVAQCLVYQSYPGSFFFWLDLVGTVTLLADLSYTYAMFGYAQSDLTVARGGRAGRAARTATTLRISKMVMWVRITRLIRLARVLRQFRLMIQNKFKKTKQSKKRKISSSRSVTSDILNIPGGLDSDLELSDNNVTSTNTRRNSQIMPWPAVNGSSKLKGKASTNKLELCDEDEEEDSSRSSIADTVREAHSSRIGVRVADSITRNVVFGILLTVCLVPIFNGIEEESYSAMYLAMDIFNDQYAASSVSLNTTIDSFLSSVDSENVYYLNVGGIDYANDVAVGKDLRLTEYRQFSEGEVLIKLDISKAARFEHVMAIGFTFLVVSLFAGLAFMISKNITKLVVHPIEKMTKIVQEFTKNICLLGDNLDDQHKIVTELLETEVIEAAITTLGNIFSSLLDQKRSSLSQSSQRSSIHSLGDDMKRNNSASSANEMMLDEPKKHSFIAPLRMKTGKTLIKSRETIMSINITQQKRVLIEDEEIMERIRVLEQSGDIDTFCIQAEKIAEFASLRSVMEHPIACEYFRLYCVSHMLSESFFFLKAVTEYKKDSRAAFVKVYNAHISDKAKWKISILEKESKKLFDAFKSDNFGMRVFDDAKREIHASLSSEAFCTFVRSKFAHAYVKSRDQNKTRYSHIFENHQNVKSLLSPK